MGQYGTATAQWLFEDTAKGEFQRQDLKREKQKLAEEKRKLEQEKREFQFQRQIEEKRLLQEKQLFETKWRILERELQKLAKDRQDIELEKEQYYNNSRRSSFPEEGSRGRIRGELFFSGVGSERALKKRYRELIKIFHPDNADGDNDTLLEINREYDNLRKAFGM